MENQEKKYVNGTIAKANIRESKNGNAVLGLGVQIAGTDEFEWVNVTLMEKLKERNLPTLQRAFGCEFTEGTAAEILDKSERGLLRPQVVTIAIVEPGTPDGYTTKYVNDPRTVRVFDNRGDSGSPF